ncbi:MAG: N-acetyltransferase [Nitrospirae bacterium]|nr:MAG: N-acetyltransferase [Nitrospirota bacterium]
MDLFSQSHFAGVGAIQSQDSLPTGTPEDILLQSELGAVLTDAAEASAAGIQAYAAPIAATNPQLVKLVSHIFNESFGYRPDGRPYRLGPKSVSERLQETDHLFVAGDEQSGVGYLFGKEITSSQGRIAWIESMAVLPLYRRRGIATAMVKRFWQATKNAPRFGCATPNPIAALIVSRVVPGKLYVGQSDPPHHLRRLLKEIKQNCFDLRGCSIDERTLTIKTGFSPLSRSDERDWSPRTPQAPPHWWAWIQHLPNEFEALLLIES